MSVGEPIGQLLRFMVSTTKTKNILEIGTFTGYSALSMLEGLPKNQGKIITCEIDPDHAKFALENIKNHPNFNNRVTVMVGEALNSLKIIKEKNELFDLIFIDADKINNLNYYKYLVDNKLIKKGGILIFDNVLYRGKVAYSENTDERSIYTRAFNEYVKNDQRTRKILLPIRDGLFFIEVL